MRHLRVMAVVASTKCERCNKDFSCICLHCNCCEKCHLDQIVEDSWLYQTPFVLLLGYALIIAFVWTGVTYVGIKEQQKPKTVCACEK